MSLPQANTDPLRPSSLLSLGLVLSPDNAICLVRSCDWVRSDSDCDAAAFRHTRSTSHPTICRTQEPTSQVLENV
jgi:hypothetical protein